MHRGGSRGNLRERRIYLSAAITETRTIADSMSVLESETEDRQLQSRLREANLVDALRKQAGRRRTGQRVSRLDNA